MKMLLLIMVEKSKKALAKVHSKLRAELYKLSVVRTDNPIARCEMTSSFEALKEMVKNCFIHLHFASSINEIISSIEALLEKEMIKDCFINLHFASSIK